MSALPSARSASAEAEVHAVREWLRQLGADLEWEAATGRPRVAVECWSWSAYERVLVTIERDRLGHIARWSMCADNARPGEQVHATFQRVVGEARR